MLGVPIGFGLAFLFTDQLQGILRDVHRFERWLVLLAPGRHRDLDRRARVPPQPGPERETRMLRDAGSNPSDVL